ncbi:MAG: hypothetical protein UF433_12040 [Clostridium sp.]|nr:hypothetical protein [Clostridium sp.]
MTIPAFIIMVFCAIGIIVSMNFIMDAIFKAMASSRERKKKRQESLDKISEKLDEISKNLNK